MALEKTLSSVLMKTFYLAASHRQIKNKFSAIFALKEDVAEPETKEGRNSSYLMIHIS